jgi:hypothetical protein
MTNMRRFYDAFEILQPVAVESVLNVARPSGPCPPTGGTPVPHWKAEILQTVSAELPDRLRKKSPNGASYNSPGWSRQAEPWEHQTTNRQAPAGRNNLGQGIISPFQGLDTISLVFQGRRFALPLAIAWRPVGAYVEPYPGAHA